MKYIELYGLPGAGKTTVSVPVINRLRDSGLKVADLSAVYFRNCKSKNKLRVLVELAFSYKNYLIYLSLIRYGFTAIRTYDGLASFFKLFFLIHQLMMTIRENRYDLVLCEEGVIQYLSSLNYTEEMRDNTALALLFTRLQSRFDIIAVNCRISVEESMNRIKGRGETSRRYSRKTPSDLLRLALRTKERNLTTIAKYLSKVHTLPMEQSRDSVVLSLFNLVQQEMPSYE